MPQRSSYDAIVIGAGPNGLAAAVTLAEAGRRVLVLEANETLGGGVRSMPLTEPGFVHDFGAAVFPFGPASPFFRRLPLGRYGLEWVHPEVPFAHPLDGGRAALAHRSLDETAAGLGRDGAAWRRLAAPVVEAWDRIETEILRPMLHVPRYPLAMLPFAWRAALPAAALAKWFFETEEARALWAGGAAHAVLPLSAPASSAPGLVLTALAHRSGWPFPRGGAQALTDALVAYLRELGGEVVTGERVTDLGALPQARAVLCDLAPSHLADVAGERLPAGYRRKLRRFRRGPAAFKVDYALSAPVPWANADVARAGTVHLGGSFEEIAEAEAVVHRGRPPQRPYVLLAQPSLFDGTRAPGGQHTLWAYGHVPHASDHDLTAAIEAQIERFAPGFRAVVVARHVSPPAWLEAHDANLVGGDIVGGAADLRQVIARPVLSPRPYRTPAEGLYLCSSSTPPGAGVHGMCGYQAARTALADGAV